MATPTRVVDGVKAAANDVNQLIDLLEGAAGLTESYLLIATPGADIILRMSDAAAARKVKFQDSASADVWTVDSDGNMVVAGSMTLSGALILPQSATPAQTAEGSIAWDTDDDLLKVGTGTGTKTIGLTRGAGLSATALAELAYDTTAAQLNVWNGSASVSAAAKGEQWQLGGGSLLAPTGLAETGRVKLVDFNATAVASHKPVDLTDNYSFGLFPPVGGLLPFSGQTSTTSTDAAQLLAVVVTGRVLTLTGSNAPAGTSTFGLVTGYHQGSNGSGVTAAGAVAPNRSPWMRLKMNPTAGGSASLNTRIFGFFDSVGSGAVPNGAYLRRNTTGNLFFVTRQGGAETTTDLGAQTNAQRWYDIYTPDAGVTWKCYDHTGAAVATHTTNVPTAITDLIVGHFAQQNTTSVSSALSRIFVSYIDN